MGKTYEERIRDWQQITEKIKKTIIPGVLPSPPDPRDYNVEDIPIATPRLPNKYILPIPPIVLNQGNTPYCGGASGAGIANAYYHSHSMMPKEGFSMAFIYWICKRYDGIPGVRGTYIRTVLKVMQKYGCAPESLARFSPYQIDISPEALRAAENYKIEAYAKLNTLSDIQIALNKNMYIIVGTLVTSKNWNTSNGFLSLPKGDLYGGHATFFFGYDNLLDKGYHLGYNIGQNSWGEQWGDKGRYFLPYDYLKATYEGQPAFLEAWGVKFVDIKPAQPKPIEPNPSEKRSLNWKGRKYRGKIK
jgi:hypothetical protein